VTGQYVLALVELARRAIAEGRYAAAADLLTRARSYPDNLGEGKLAVARENDILYFLGCAHEGLGDAERARALFALAAAGLSEPTSARYYNDQPPDAMYYQGLALRKLGDAGGAGETFQRLLDYGVAHLGDDPVIDYFAVSLPDFLVFEPDLGRTNRVHCHYMMALGHRGLGNLEAAREQLERVLELDAAHVGATIHHAEVASDQQAVRI
jgi:tetratricopeptide (TPR) repeat protein